MTKDNQSINKKEISPKIYAYSESNPDLKGWLKVGYTIKSAKERIESIHGVKMPKFAKYNIELEESAIRNDGSYFQDHAVHRILEKKGFERDGKEWFKCSTNDVKAAILAVKSGKENIEDRFESFKMRPEQKEAVEMTYNFFKLHKKPNSNKPLQFLWNAKMRFGKTFAAYQLAKKMEWKKVLVLTFKPAVKNAWESDLKNHIDFEGWQFVAKNTFSIEFADKSKPIVTFGSFQDYLGTDSKGKVKPANQWVHKQKWDCVIIDEYHFGAWRQTSKDLFEAEDDKEKNYQINNSSDDFDKDLLAIKANHFLYLSGTPFRAIETGEFIEDQIYNWTYQDEQKAKEQWNKPDNPYSALPKMKLYTYQLPEEIKKVATKGEFDEFDLNVFFSTDGETEKAVFKYENEVQKWLNLIRGQHFKTEEMRLKEKRDAPPFPFSDVTLLNELSHTLWFLPNVASCYAMKNLLMKNQNKFYQDYEILVAAGAKAGIGEKALEPIQKAMQNAFVKNTITLTCGKLTTGVTVEPWSGILMLRNLSTPETYFQAAFRVQSPWTIENDDKLSPNKKLILKKECFVFDFAPDRALKQISEYSIRLNTKETSTEKKVEEFIKFLPILAYDNATMKEIDAAGVLEMAISGTTATMLARRWESALLVNVDNATLAKLLDNKELLAKLEAMPAFRSLNKEIETIINKSDIIKKAKGEALDKEPTKNQKKILTDAEKEYRENRRKVQEKLIKFATRIPIFMYLTDNREETLDHIIKNIEPDLFSQVTGLSTQDFDALVELGLYNKSRMNYAVDGFRRYEEKSLSYIGINRHLTNKNIQLPKIDIKFSTINTKKGARTIISL